MKPVKRLRADIQRGDKPMTEKPKTLQDLIEEAREQGFRDVADTMDMMAYKNDVFNVDATEQPISGERALLFRIGLVTGYAVTGAEIPEEQRSLTESLRNNGNRRLSDTFEYCINRKPEVLSDGFDYDVLPLEADELAIFSLGLTFGIAHKRAG